MTSSAINTANNFDNMLSISLAFAPSVEVNLYVDTSIEAGTTLYQALVQVGWLDEYPDLKQWCEENKDNLKIDNKSWRVGVYSQKRPLSYILQPHDRVEVYRPLTIDPMRKRKRRAVQ